jgi:C4-dicarboxylate-specific signal transduction histidine kinase
LATRQHKFVFRPRARLVSVLGEHLISDQAVGLIELVKNAYDADATHVEVQILHTKVPERTTIVVLDDGCGMTLEELQNKWLSPAVNHKEREKNQRKRTPKGRIPIGEKGVGRFAVHQLARKCELVTRAKDAPELVVELCWDDFDDGTRFLDGVDVRVTERAPVLFTGTKTGTRMTLSGARSPWQERLLKKVHRTLRMLQSPLRDSGTTFEIQLLCPEHQDLQNLAPTEIFSKAHYEFRVSVSEDGQCDFVYTCGHPGVPRREKSGSENLVRLARGELQAEEPACGPFYLNLYVWDRTRNFLTQSGISRQELDAQCGISLFRDGLRVLPYGEPGDDWLFLDQDRIQAPSERIGNNQVIGLVQIDQVTNLRLRDKTNREGLIENDAFLDLRVMLRAAIRLFLVQWKKDRPREEDASARPTGTVSQARSIANALKKSAKQDVKVQVPEDAFPKRAPGRGVVAQTQAVDLLISNLDGAEQALRNREKRLEVLVDLAATGMAAERVVHEFGRQVRGALDSLEAIRPAIRSNERASRALGVLDACLGALRNEFRVLAPYESVERAQKEGRIDLHEAVELALSLNEEGLAKARIKVGLEGNTFSIRAKPASVVQVLDNLVHNASYWLGVSEQSQRRLGILLDGENRTVLVADNGPGVHESAVEHVFDAFFTMKTDGRGLGLYISRELVRMMGGRIRLAEPRDRPKRLRWASGAVFILEFPTEPR